MTKYLHEKQKIFCVEFLMYTQQLTFPPYYCCLAIG